MKNYASMDIAIALTNIHENPEDEVILEGVAIPHKNLEAFLEDVVALAEKHGGAGFLELMDNDEGDNSITACIKQHFREHANHLILEAERILSLGSHKMPRP